MNYKIKVNLGIKDCFGLLFLFLGVFLLCSIIEFMIPIVMPFSTIFCCLVTAMYFIKRVLESIQIVADGPVIQKKEINTNSNSGTFNQRIEELENKYHSLNSEEEKIEFLKTLNNNPTIKDREQVFKDFPDETIEELSESDMIAKYILLKRKNII